MSDVSYTKAERAAIDAAYRAMWRGVEGTDWTIPARMETAEKHEKRQGRGGMAVKALMVECFADGFECQRHNRPKLPADVHGYSLGLILAWCAGGEVARREDAYAGERPLLPADWLELAAAAKAAHHAALARALDGTKAAIAAACR